jgi:hypothetical protein
MDGFGFRAILCLAFTKLSITEHPGISVVYAVTTGSEIVALKIAKKGENYKS